MEMMQLFKSYSYKKGYIMLAKIHTLSKNILQNFQSLSLLLARLAIAYGFLDPALNKWSNMKGTADFFGSIGIPFPMLNAYMAATTELLGVILLTIGLLTRLISVPLMVVMVVAITTVHLAHGFYEPALGKWTNFQTTVAWFNELGIPFAYLATFLTASFEVVGVILLTLGLFIRFISLPLMIILFVAITTVHIGHGFSVANNGFEIPLYYILFLAILATHGAGRFSIDKLIFDKEQ